MPLDQNNLYSQGLNFGSFIQHGVDPRTGQYTCAIDLYEAPVEARNCPPFKLSLSHNPLAPQDMGLGKGWSFNLSSYQCGPSPPILYLATGEHYRVEEGNDGLKIKDQKLISFRFQRKDRGYQIIHKSGLVEILSDDHNTYSTAVPIELQAATGRSLKLCWTIVENERRLTKVQDGSQDLLQIVYKTPRVEVTRAPGTPEASTFTLVQNEGQLNKLELPLGSEHAWWFDYLTTDNGITCLRRVTDPAGLVEDLTYEEKGHKLPDKAPYETIPYVKVHTVRPGDRQPEIVSYYDYSPDHNFLGYRSGFEWKAGQDNLHCIRGRYDYWVAITVGTDGPKKTYTYNKFHLQVEKKVEKKRQQGSTLVKQAMKYYASDEPFEDQVAQYQLPKSIETTYEYGGHVRTETTQHEFDEWGNPTSETQINGIKIERVYYPRTGEIDSSTKNELCPADPHGFQRYLKEEKVIPSQEKGLRPAPLRSKRYTYLKPYTAIDASSFVAVGQLETLENNRSVSSTICSYINPPTSGDQSECRDYGRLHEQVTRLSGQYPTTHRWTYRYYPQANQVTKTTTTIGSDNLSITSYITSSLFSGLTVAHTDEEGIERNFEYDKIGRQIKSTVSPGTPYEATQQHKYTIYTIAHRVSRYCLTVTDAKGVQTLNITDGLERVVRVEKQDADGRQNPEKAPDAPFRVIEERHYNNLGQCIEVDNIDWLRTKNDEPREQRSKNIIEYDDWGQVRRVTVRSGEETLSATLSISNPVDLTHREGIEGEGETKTYFNLFGVTTRTELLLNAANTPYSKIDYIYDGLGRLVEESDNNNHRTQYKLDSFGRVIRTTWPDGRNVQTTFAAQSTKALPALIEVKGRVMGKQSFDGLGRVISRTIGKRTTKRCYNQGEPKPCLIETPNKDKHELTYLPKMNWELASLKQR